MTARTKLLASFRPAIWAEVAYVKSPPFVVDMAAGRVVLVPRDAEAESGLEHLTPVLGLKKRRQGRVSYIVSRASAIRTLREFDWIVRRSWLSDDIAVIWALAYLGEKRDWARVETSLEDVADLAGLSSKECSEALARLFHARAESGWGDGLGELAADKKLVEGALEKAVAKLPSWTEEMVMRILCSSAGGSVAEIHESAAAEGLTIGAVYKVVERLKDQGFVYPARYYRVSDRGPMREMLSADCRNCFYGYTNPDSCLQETLSQLDWVLQRDYGKVPTREERAALYTSMKNIPYSSRINRRVLESLRLMSEVERVTKEGRVSGILRKIEEHYGVELPVGKAS
ncbi:MAG TPA: hypothetical protein VKF15_08105 [Nitrososphaerales archaeon]|nr:hypothetical protein [Nitrososphaerales archaeon]